MSTALETPIEERVYTPASIEEAYRNFPAVGRRITIAYRCEYMGSTGRNSEAKKRVMRAKVVQKVKHPDGAHFTVELIPKDKEGMRGSYRVGFQFVDLIIGRVKILGVSG